MSRDLSRAGPIYLSGLDPEMYVFGPRVQEHTVLQLVITMTNVTCEEQFTVENCRFPVRGL